MTRSSSCVPRIGTALTGSVVEPACGQHDSYSHHARPFPPLISNDFHEPSFGNPIAQAAVEWATRTTALTAAGDTKRSRSGEDC